MMQFAITEVMLWCACQIHHGVVIDPLKTFVGMKFDLVPNL